MVDKPIKLGKYTLGEQLGSGGFGTVYKATDPSGRTVAIKVLKPGWSDDPATVERFRRESQVAGELFHSRIATIIDSDEADGRLFLVMRYIDGVPLDQLIKEKGRIQWVQALQILEQVAEGLDYAHRRGLVHRDLKPGNIIVSEKDGAVLTDFGLVKAADVSGMSTSGVMLGTPQYIAPEIWAGKPATPQTDIYSLACVAYEMLTGQVLFSGSTPPEVMSKHMQPAPPLPAKSPPGLPAALRSVIVQALQMNLTRRYPDVQAFLEDLKKQAASLKQEVAARAQGLAREAETLIQHNELALAREKLDQLNELAPDSLSLAVLEKKIESMTRLNGVYGEVVKQYQVAQEKARTILAENPVYPDAKGIFPGLGLRGGKPFSVSHPTQVENTELRWQEKTLPYLLIVLGLVGLATSSWLGWIGLLGVIAGIGLFSRKKWGRRMGMVFASFLEVAGLATSVGFIIYMGTNRIISDYYVYVNVLASLGGCLAMLLAIGFIHILGGKRMMAWMNESVTHPSGLWSIFMAYLATGIGILPAILILMRKPFARIGTQIYAILLIVALPIAGFIVAFEMSVINVHNIIVNNIVGQLWTANAVIFFVILSSLAFRYLRSPEIRAYFENREA